MSSVESSTGLRRVPVQARSRRTVEAILTATRRILESDGSAALNTNRLAREAGIGVGSLYEYFRDKRSIVRALSDHVAAEEAAVVLERLDAVDDGTLEQAIAVACATAFELHRANHSLYRSLAAAGVTAREVGHRPGARALLQVVRERLERRAGELHIDDLELTALTCFHIVESLAAQLAPCVGPRWSAELCTEQIERAVCGYLGLRRGGGA